MNSPSKLAATENHALSSVSGCPLVVVSGASGSRIGEDPAPRSVGLAGVPDLLLVCTRLRASRYSTRFGGSRQVMDCRSALWSCSSCRGSSLGQLVSDSDPGLTGGGGGGLALLAAFVAACGFPCLGCWGVAGLFPAVVGEVEVGVVEVGVEDDVPGVPGVTGWINLSLSGLLSTKF